MSLEQQLIYLFSSLGAVNGFLLGGYFVLIKKDKRLSDFFLGAMLIMLSIRIIKSVFLYFNPQLFQLFVQFGLSACLFIGPFLYLYVVSMTNRKHNLRKTWWCYLIPSILLIIWLSYNYPYTGEPNMWGPYVKTIYKLWLAFILAAGYHFRNIITKIWKKDKSLSNQEFWLLQIYIGVVLIYFAYETSSYTSYIVGALSFSFIFYLSILLRIYNRNRRSIASDPPIKYANSTLEIEDVRINLDRLTTMMKQNQSYLDPTLTLSKLSTQMGIGSKELSQSINQVTGENYSKYIASLRVEHAKQLLKSPDHQYLKIASIAYDCGFNSLSSFNATFKKLTGISPNEYQKSESI